MEDFLDRLENPFILLHEIRWFNNTFTSENQKVRIFFSLFSIFFIFWKFLSILIPIMGIIWTTCTLRNFMFSLFRGTISASITNLTVECFFIQILDSKTIVFWNCISTSQHFCLKKPSLSLNDSINLFKILFSQHHSPDFIFRYKQHHKIQRYLSFEITPDNKWNEIQVHVFTKHCFIRNQCFLHSYTLLSTEC